MLGTLDVNQGVTLPAEELAGKFPRDDDPVRPGTDTSQDGRGPGEEKKKKTQTGDTGDAGAGETGVRATRVPTRVPQQRVRPPAGAGDWVSGSG